MPKGDAFNRLEVSSVYVSPQDRFVVSFIVGYAPDQVDNAPVAAAAFMEMLCGEGSETTHLSVYDRATGQTVSMTKEEVAMFMMKPPDSNSS